jgi:(p)ppGpp synthase/HD superfamily hydrolase
MPLDKIYKRKALILNKIRRFRKFLKIIKEKFRNYKILLKVNKRLKPIYQIYTKLLIILTVNVKI